MDEYIETDLATDTLCSLQMVEWALNETKTNIQMWKWVILGAHSALQSAMVAHLSGTMQIGALTEDSANEWVEYLNKRVREGPYPKSILAKPNLLLNRLGKLEKRLEASPSCIIKVSSRERKSFEKLENIRNELVHFKDVNWSIEPEYLLIRTADATNIINRIIIDGYAIRHMTDQQKVEIRRIVSQILRDLTS